MYMKISNRRLRKIRKIKNPSSKKYKSHKRKRGSGKKRSFRRKNYVNLRLQTLKNMRKIGGGNVSASSAKGASKSAQGRRRRPRQHVKAAGHHSAGENARPRQRSQQSTARKR